MSRKKEHPIAQNLLLWFLKKVLSVLFLAVLLLFARYAFTNMLFTHHLIVNQSAVERQLEGIGELATYQYTYKGTETVANTRQVLKVDIPGTTHRISFSYSGVIKVGYTISDILVHVDSEARTIEITLPAPVILDNYILEDSLSHQENNNIFNPIKGNDIITYLNEIKDKELSLAIDQGLYDLAEQNAKEIIAQVLSVFEDYEPVFRSQ